MKHTCHVHVYHMYGIVPRASGDQEATSPQTTTIPRQEGAGEGGRGHAEIEGGKTPDPGDKEPAPLVTVSSLFRMQGAIQFHSLHIISIFVCLQVENVAL